MTDSSSYIHIPCDSAISLLSALIILSLTLVLASQARTIRTDRPIGEIILIQLAIFLHLFSFSLYSWLPGIPSVLFWTRMNYTAILLIALTGALFSNRIKKIPPITRAGLFTVLILLTLSIWLKGNHYFLPVLNPAKNHNSLVKGELFSPFIILNILICAYLVIRTSLSVFLRKEAGEFRPLMIGLAGGFLVLGAYGLLSAVFSLARTQSWIGMIIMTACFTWYTQSFICKDQKEKEILEQEMTRYLEDLIHDGLTGVYSRDYIWESLSHCISQLRRNFRLYALLYIDLDGMKEINDEAGHEGGDEILKILGEVLLHETRESDIPARIGGDEFLLLMDDCPPEQALNAAEGIRDRFQAKSREALSDLGFDRQPTLSMGILCSRHWEGDEKNIISRADEAMYQSKKRGKNRITLYSRDL